MPIDFPAGFVGGDDRTAANGLTQRGIGRLGLPRRAVQGARDGTGRHREADALAQEPGDLAMRQPELLVEDHHEGDGLRPELHGGGPQRVGGLQRMAALHPASTHRAASDPDIKAAHDRVHDRQLFLILRCHAGRRHGAGAVGTRRRHRNGDSPHRHAPVAVGDRGAHAVPRVGARAAAGAAVGGPFEKGAAWRLPARRARSSSCFSRSFSRRSRSRSRSRTRNLDNVNPTGHARVSSAPGPAATDRFVVQAHRRGHSSIRHIEVMPDSGTLYKSRMFGMEGQTR